MRAPAPRPFRKAAIAGKPAPTWYCSDIASAGEAPLNIAFDYPIAFAAMLDIHILKGGKPLYASERGGHTSKTDTSLQKCISGLFKPYTLAKITPLKLYHPDFAQTVSTKLLRQIFRCPFAPDSVFIGMGNNIQTISRPEPGELMKVVFKIIRGSFPIQGTMVGILGG